MAVSVLAVGLIVMVSGSDPSVVESDPVSPVALCPGFGRVDTGSRHFGGADSPHRRA